MHHLTQSIRIDIERRRIEKALDHFGKAHLAKAFGAAMTPLLVSAVRLRRTYASMPGNDENPYTQSLSNYIQSRVRWAENYAVRPRFSLLTA